MQFCYGPYFSFTLRHIHEALEVFTNCFYTKYKKPYVYNFFPANQRLTSNNIYHQIGLPLDLASKDLITFNNHTFDLY